MSHKVIVNFFNWQHYCGGLKTASDPLGLTGLTDSQLAMSYAVGAGN